MPYNPSYTDYPATQARTDTVGQVSWTQSLLIQNYSADKYIVIDKEIKGGLHRVKYKSQLTQTNYDGIFTSRRVKGMLVYVELEDDDSPCNKYFSLRQLPGNLITHWVEIGSGASVTLNNPKTVLDETGRDELERIILTETISVTATDTLVTGTNTLFITELTVGDKIKIDNTVYDVTAINSDTELVIGQAAQGTYTNVDFYKILVAPNDFVNVVDIDGAGTPASFIWDGYQWLQIYPYGSDPNSHAPNTDTQIMAGVVAITGVAIKAHLDDTSYHKLYNDSTSVATAAAGLGNEAWSSKKIAEELQKRPEVDTVNGDTTLFLNQKGSWVAPSGGSGGASLQAGDILGGGGADDAYFN